MLLTLTTTHTPADDLGYLLHKHPARVQTFKLKFGQAHVFYPEASEQRCTAALLLDIDPIELYRSRRLSGGGGFALRQYVNDRPYVASSLLSVAIAEVFGTALSGRCQARPALVDAPLPLTARLSALPARGGAELLERLFAPLGYTVQAESIPLDPRFPEWGDSQVYTVELRAVLPLKDLLAHLYVLIPVLDGDKHYYVGQDEIDKLLARGEGWLPQHPARELIVSRYLRRRRELAESALERLLSDDAPPPEPPDDASGQPLAAFAPPGEGAPAPEAPEPGAPALGAPDPGANLRQQRLDAALRAIRHSGAQKVLDLGCGEGRLLQLLLPEPQVAAVTGMDVSARTLERAEKRLQLDRLPEAQRSKLTLIQGSLLYRDSRLEGFDAAVLLEVIEHLEPERLDVMEKVLFGSARPGLVIVSTPNHEYNPLMPGLPDGQFRHPDHHFEWTRAEFQAWAARVAAEFGYAVAFTAIGPEDAQAGPPTQMGIFTR